MFKNRHTKRVAYENRPQKAFLLQTECDGRCTMHGWEGRSSMVELRRSLDGWSMHDEIRMDGRWSMHAEVRMVDVRWSMLES